MKKVRKVGSGRKKGSFSFCNVTLLKLNELLRPNMVVKVSRRWAIDLGVVEADVVSVADAPVEKVEVKATEFEEQKIQLKENW